MTKIEAIRSMVELKLIVLEQQKKNGDGPKVIPCEDCKYQTLKANNPCGDPEGPLQERRTLICPQQKGLLKVSRS